MQRIGPEKILVSTAARREPGSFESIEVGRNTIILAKWKILLAASSEAAPADSR